MQSPHSVSISAAPSSAYSSSSGRAAAGVFDVLKAKVADGGCQDLNKGSEGDFSETATTQDSCDGIVNLTYQEFIENFVDEMSKNKRRRGKRKNAVKLFRSSVQAFNRQIHDEYNKALFDRSHADGKEVQNHLYASARLVQEFINVQDLISQMSDYLPKNLNEEVFPEPQQFIFDLTEKYIHSRLYSLYKDQDLTAGEAAEIITWIDANFLAGMNQQLCSNVQVSDSWNKYTDELLGHYLENGVCRVMREQIKRSIAMLSDEDIRTSSTGAVVTGLPEQIVLILDSQLEAARKYLPQKHAPSILVACYREIIDMVSYLQYQIGECWRETSPIRFCSMINDATRLAEFMEDRNESLPTINDQEVAENVFRDLAGLSLQATILLCERMIVDLCEPENILSGIGRTEWEADDAGTFIGCTIETVQDFFDDMQTLLSSPDYLFPKILNHCIDLTLQTYVQSFYSNTIAMGVQDAVAVSANLSRDHARLVAFFTDAVFERYTGRTGSLTAPEVNSRLQVIQSLSRLVNPSIPSSELTDDVNEVLAKIKGCDGLNTSAILHLARLRHEEIRHSSPRALEWLQINVLDDKVLQLTEDFCEKQQIIVVQTPKLRSPRYGVRNFYSRAEEALHITSPRSHQKAEAIIKRKPNAGVRKFVGRRKKQIGAASKKLLGRLPLPLQQRRRKSSDDLLPLDQR